MDGWHNRGCFGESKWELSAKSNQASLIIYQRNSSRWIARWTKSKILVSTFRYFPHLDLVAEEIIFLCHEYPFKTQIAHPQCLLNQFLLATGSAWSGNGRSQRSRYWYDVRWIAHNQKTSLCRCVGTHHRYLGQTDNFDRAVSRLLIMGNRPDMIWLR